MTGTIINNKSVFENIPRQSLSADEINSIHANTVTELLRGIPGVDVTQQGGEGGLTFVSLRGGDPNFTVVMIDGIKVDDPTNSRGGGYDFAGLDPLMIETIDVFFGSFSAVYGSDALGGAISIKTKGSSSSLKASGILEIGSRDSRAAAMYLAGPVTDSISAGISATSRDSDGGKNGDSIDRQQLRIQLSNNDKTNSNLNWMVSVFASQAEAESYPISSGGNQLAVIRDTDRREFEQLITGGNIEWSPVQHWNLQLSGGWAHYEEQNISPGIAAGVFSGVPPLESDSEYERGNLIFSNSLSLNGVLDLGFGAELIHEQGQIKSLIDFGFPIAANFTHQRNTWALFAEAAVHLNKPLSLITSVRRDDTEKLSSTNGRIALNFNIEQSASTISLIYSEGFKLPSLFALGHPLTGNPDLDPESSRSYAFEFRQPLFNDQIQTAISIYHNRFKDLVDFDANTFSHVNRDSATTKGIDASFSAKLGSSVRFRGSASYLHTKVSDGSRLERRPKWKGAMGLSWQPAEAWLLTLQGNIKGDFYDAAIPTGEVILDGYTHIDSSIQWQMTKKIQLKLLLKNAFDNSYEEAVGFSAEDREARLSIIVAL
ncbi:MAG: TonB-dependent receptor [Gammaproteobacteria bacterium]|nr:TonB-dependent receptor [Gammaproteobacteria bacterium]